MPDYRLNSRPQSQYCSQINEQPEYLFIVSQPNIYAAVLNILHPNPQQVSPPYLPNEPKPHQLSCAPFEEHSFRIKLEWFKTWRGPCHDILELSSLITRRGGCAVFPTYKVHYLQRSNSDLAFVFKQGGASRPLIDAIKDQDYDVLKAICD